MSDLAKRVAERVRLVGFQGDVTKQDCLADFIERAQALREWGWGHGIHAEDMAAWQKDQEAYDAALRDLAQAMEVE